jgi:hypothetical protein
MPERSTREVVHSLAIHREQLVADLHELENIVRYYLGVPRRIRAAVLSVRLSRKAYVVLAGAGLLVMLGSWLSRRRG